VTLDLATILGALPGLTSSERAKVVAACQVLGTEAADDSRPSTPEELLWRGYQRFGEESGVVLPPLSVVKKMSAYAGFRAASQALDPWILEHFKIQDESQRAKAYRVVGRCVMRMIEGFDAPWTPATLMRQAASATAAVDLQFPGYAQAGWLPSTL